MPLDWTRTKLLGPPTFETAAVLNDHHFPFHDPTVLNLSLRILADTEPEYIFLAGDVLDCYELSKYRQHPEFATGIVDELAMAKRYLQKLRATCPNAKIIYIQGNHEKRLQNYVLDHAKAVYGITKDAMERLLGLDELNIKYIKSNTQEDYYKWGKVYVGHFAKVSKHSGYTAKNLIDDKGVTCIQSHVHRVGWHSRRYLDRQVDGWENGCMCDLSPAYLNHPNWQNAFCFVHQDFEAGEYFITPIFIKDGKTFYGNRYYQATAEDRKDIYR